MSEFFETAKRIARDHATLPSAAYRRAKDIIESGREMTMPDRDIVVAATYAIRQEPPHLAMAIVLLGELELRMVATEPLEHIERRAA